MKNRFIILAVGILMVCLLPVTASAQNSQEWQSTSAMKGSGSAYSPHVTAVGAAEVSDMATTTSSSFSSKRLRRATMNNDPWGENQDAGETDPNSPLGDGLLPLMLMALAFAGATFLVRKRSKISQ